MFYMARQAVSMPPCQEPAMTKSGCTHLHVHLCICFESLSEEFWFTYGKLGPYFDNGMNRIFRKWTDYYWHMDATECGKSLPWIQLSQQNATKHLKAKTWQTISKLLRLNTKTSSFLNIQKTIQTLLKFTIPISFHTQYWISVKVTSISQYLWTALYSYRVRDHWYYLLLFRKNCNGH